MSVLQTAFITFSTIATSCSLILTNKYLMNNFNFHWPITLTVYHFFVTYGVLEIMSKMHLFVIADNVPVYCRWLLALYNTMSIAFMNVNLRTNSIGFYQLSKLCTVPIMVAVNYFYYKKKTPIRTLFALTILLSGLYIFSVNDVQFNILGTIYAAIGVLSTVASQMYNGNLQKHYSTSGTSLQHITALPQAILAIFVAIAFEGFGNDSIIRHNFTIPEIVTALVTGLIAVGSNVSAFAFIGKTSPVTYQVVGHVKTLLIFVIGLALFPPSVPEPREKMMKKYLGLVFGMIGTVLYTTFELLDKRAAQRQDADRLDDDSKAGNDNSISQSIGAEVNYEVKPEYVNNEPFANDDEDTFEAEEDKSNMKEEI